MRGNRQGAGLLAAFALLVLAAPAPAIPPLPLGSVPCLDILANARTVNVAVAPGAPLPALPGARWSAGIPQLGVRSVQLPDEAAAVRAVDVLKRTPGVRWAEREMAVQAHKTPNDPLFRVQYALRVTGAPRGWDRETGRSAPVLVGVLDTGVDPQHPELLGRVRSGGDFVDGDADPDDGGFHGTAVSGVIAASTNNKAGVAGVSWGASVVAERVLGDAGGTSCTVAAGIVDAVDAGAKVLNLSLGGPGTSCPFLFEQTIAYADDHGALVVASAGNDGAKGNPVDYPAGCEGTLAVAATDGRDKTASFSEYGPQVDIAAPGVGVLTTYRIKAGRYGYSGLSGTSFSAPMVSGAAALLLARHPTWTPAQVRARLLTTAKDLGPHGRDDRYGAGRLDIARALS